MLKFFVKKTKTTTTKTKQQKQNNKNTQQQQQQNMSVISLEYVQKWKIVAYSLSTWLTIPQSFNLIG